MEGDFGSNSTPHAGCKTLDCRNGSPVSPDTTTHDIFLADTFKSMSTVAWTGNLPTGGHQHGHAKLAVVDTYTNSARNDPSTSNAYIADNSTFWDYDNRSISQTSTMEEADKNWAVLAVIPIIALVAMGNLLVILSVKMDHKLRSSTNYFLTSLAVADLLVALTVMPPSLGMIINNYAWPFSESLCGVWAMLDVCFSTSSILHLCMISLDRYLALAKPFQYNGGWMTSGATSGGWSNENRGQRRWRVGSGLSNGASKTTKRVAKRIFLVWAVSFGISLPLPILASQDRDNIFVGDMCAINIREFIIYGSMVAFFLPLIVMFVTYSLTIRTLQKQSRMVARVMGKESSRNMRKSLSTSSSTSSRRSMKKGSQRSLSGSSFRPTAIKFGGKRKGTPVDRLPYVVCTNEKGVVAENIPLNNQSSADSTGSETSTPFLWRSESKIKLCAMMCCSCIRRNEFNAKPNAEEEDSDSSDTSSINQAMRRSPMLTRANMKLAKAVSKFPLKRISTRRISVSMKSRAIATEQRASKVLGMIFTLFCIFWCPFFITNVLSQLCTTCDPEVIGNLLNWFVWVGYVSSGVNPCVYTLFSKRFRDTFRKLLTRRYSEIGRRPLVRAYSNYRSGPGNSSRGNFQFSMESGELMSTETFGKPEKSARIIHQRNNTPFGDSVIKRQHRRSQHARSVDADLLKGKSSQAAAATCKDVEGILPDSEIASRTRELKLQWRTTWPDTHPAENGSRLHGGNRVKHSALTSHKMELERTRRSSPIRRVFSDSSQWPNRSQPGDQNEFHKICSTANRHSTNTLDIKKTSQIPVPPTRLRPRTNEDTNCYASEESVYDNDNLENVFIDDETDKFCGEGKNKPTVRFSCKSASEEGERSLSDDTPQHCESGTTESLEKFEVCLKSTFGAYQRSKSSDTQTPLNCQGRSRNLSYNAVAGKYEFAFEGSKDGLSRQDSGIGESAGSSQNVF